MSDSLVALFSSIGLDEKKAEETTKNKKVSELLVELIKEVSLP